MQQLLQARRLELQRGILKSDTQKLLTEFKPIADQFNFIDNIATDIKKTGMRWMEGWSFNFNGIYGLKEMFKFVLNKIEFMTTIAIRKKIIYYLKVADDKVKTIYTMVADEINTIENDWDEDFVKEFKSTGLNAR